MDDVTTQSHNDNTDHLYYDLDQLNNIAYDPLGTQWEEEAGPLNDIDPDSNYYNSANSKNPNNCLYYYSNNLNEETDKHHEKESLSIFHLNIRSLRKKNSLSA